MRGLECAGQYYEKRKACRKEVGANPYLGPVEHDDLLKAFGTEIRKDRELDAYLRYTSGAVLTSCPHERDKSG